MTTKEAQQDLEVALQEAGRCIQKKAESIGLFVANHRDVTKMAARKHLNN